MFNYFAIGKWVAIALLLGGMLITIKIQSVKVDSLKVDVKKEQQNTAQTQQKLDKAISDNEVNNLTIASLKGDIERLKKSYDSRMNLKDETIAYYKKLCGTGDANVTPITGNTLLDELNRMWMPKGPVK